MARLRRSARRRTRAWLVAALGLTAALGATMVPVPHGGTVGAQSPVATPWTVEVSPPGPYVDGQPLTITIRSSEEGQLTSAETQLCRLGVDYQTSTGSLPAPDFRVGGANCPSVSPSTSGDLYVLDSRTSNASRPQGSSTTFRVGEGVAQWNDRGQTRTLTCDVEHPCALVTQVRGLIDGTKTWVPHVHTVTYGESDPVAGCGGPADGILRSGGPERLAESYVAWTVAECTGPGRSGAASQAVMAGEALAMSSFQAGLADFAYSALGYHDELLLSAPDPRPSVLVPVAINAAVLAAGGGTRQTDGSRVPYSDLALTLEEAATMVSGGAIATNFIRQTIFDRNPELARNLFASPTFAVGAYAGADAATWLLTRHLTALAPETWRVPELAWFGEQAGRTRGADVSFALADPPFDQSLALYSGRSLLLRVLVQLDPNVSGGVWVVTDRATAAALAMTPVKIENAAGAFVEPSDAAVLAGLAPASTDGVVVPDPAATSAPGGVTPWPMTFVEYVVAPLEPLHDADCNPRVVSQELLEGWLRHLIGPGQRELGPGLLPLTPELRQQAEEAVARVGTVTHGTCGEPDPTSTPPTTVSTGGHGGNGANGGNGADDGGSVALPPPNLGGGGTSTPPIPPRRGGSGAVADTTPPPDGADPGEATADPDGDALVALPAFAGRRALGGAGPALAIGGLAGLSWMGALTSRGPGRRRSPAPDPEPT